MTKSGCPNNVWNHGRGCTCVTNLSGGSSDAGFPNSGSVTTPRGWLDAYGDLAAQRSELSARKDSHPHDHRVDEDLQDTYEALAALAGDASEHVVDGDWLKEHGQWLERQSELAKLADACERGESSFETYDEAVYDWHEWGAGLADAAQKLLG